MKYYICVDEDRILYVHGCFKKYAGAGRRRLEVKEWETVEPEPDMAGALARLCERHDLGGKRINLVLGRDLDRAVFSVPRAGRRAMKKMVSNELIARENGTANYIVSVDTHMSRRKGMTPVTVYYMDSRRLSAYRDAVEDNKMICAGVLMMPDCMALMAREFWKENRILVLDVEAESVGYYMVSMGHCLASSMTALRPVCFSREGALDLLYEEMAEQAGNLLENQGELTGGFAPECLVLMAPGLEEAKGAAGYLEKKLNIPCYIRTPEVYGDGADGPPVNIQCLAACAAGALGGKKRPLELTVSGYGHRKPRSIGLSASLSRGWAVFLLANGLAAAAISFHCVYLGYLAGQELSRMEQAVGDPELRERCEKARQMEGEIRERMALSEDTQAMEDAASGEHALGMDDYRAFTDAMGTGMKIESMVYEEEAGSLQMVISMEHAGDVPDYVDRLKASGRFLKVGHRLWEKREEDKTMGRVFVTVYGFLGTGEQDGIQ